MPLLAGLLLAGCGDSGATDRLVEAPAGDDPAVAAVAADLSGVEVQVHQAPG